MTRYTFIGSKHTVKKQIKTFLEKTGVDELIVATNCHNHKDRVKSVQLFAEIMNELHEDSLS